MRNTKSRLAFFLAAISLIVLAFWRPISAGQADNTMRAREFIDDHVKRLRPLEVAAARAWWTANVTGRAEDFEEKEKTQNRIDLALSDSKKFQEVKDIKAATGITDKTLAREIDLLYLTCLEKQVDPELLKKMV